jgi:hypothetical protein
VNSTIIYCFFGGYLGVLIGLRQALQKVNSARHEVRNLGRDRARQTAAIRELAKECRGAKRKLNNTMTAADRLAAEAEQLQVKLKGIRKVDNRLVVLDERRLPEDQRWVVTISGKGGTLPEATGDEGHENWTGNLRFLVWATTMDRAIKKAATRFPPSRGFKIEVTGAPDGGDPSKAA